MASPAFSAASGVAYCGLPAGEGAGRSAATGELMRTRGFLAGVISTLGFIVVVGALLYGSFTLVICRAGPAGG